MTYTSTHNPKFKHLIVTVSILRAFAASRHATVRLQDGSKGVLRGHYFVTDVLVDEVLLQRCMELEEVLSVIKSVAIKGEVVARRRGDNPLLTTGLGWRDYYLYLPAKLRGKVKPESKEERDKGTPHET